MKSISLTKGKAYSNKASAAAGKSINDTVEAPIAASSFRYVICIWIVSFLVLAVVVVPVSIVIILARKLHRQVSLIKIDSR